MGKGRSRSKRVKGRRKGKGGGRELGVRGREREGNAVPPPSETSKPNSASADLLNIPPHVFLGCD